MERAREGPLEYSGEKRNKLPARTRDGEARRTFEERRRTTMGLTRPSEFGAGGSHLMTAGTWEVSKLLHEERDATSLETVPDAKTFATAIDDIIKGRKPGRRTRAKPRVERSKARTERSKTRNDRTCVFCDRCGASFASVGNLNRHKRVSHQGMRVYCDYPDCTQVCFHPRISILISPLYIPPSSTASILPPLFL